MYVYMLVCDPGPEPVPELEPYSDKTSEPEPSSNFPVPQPCLKVVLTNRWPVVKFRDPGFSWIEAQIIDNVGKKHGTFRPLGVVL
jgi:hypothetical protein